jgi:hypothetical protein
MKYPLLFKVVFWGRETTDHPQITDKLSQTFSFGRTGIEPTLSVGERPRAETNVLTTQPRSVTFFK